MSCKIIGVLEGTITPPEKILDWEDNKSLHVGCSCPRSRVLLPAGCSSLATVTATVTDEDSHQAPSKSVARRLILLRHAKSSWDNPSLRDHDRPLSKDGKDDAAAVAQKLQLSGWIPQLILSSDATRSRETLKIIQEQVPDLLDADVHFISSFYSIASMDGQTAEHLQQAIQQAVCRYSCDEIHTVMCVGHNRAWEEAASMFTGASVELQTCNAALLEATGKSWEQAFLLAGLGRWKLQGVVKLDNKL
ncbi:hypothetical protein GH714_017822 [Hevea brasiliensis]|uniref:Phosphoglycerate mutase family protein n=1 Tax=Hevea brasiliensis TaxID=3981 RepID=A0A6A6KCI3_HEVBR|nr:hypothetical protein GH714_017822 [Hevea brasiliensis]